MKVDVPPLSFASFAKRPCVGRDGGSYGFDLPDEQSEYFFKQDWTAAKHQPD
jgi:hypothetical protein